METNSDCPEAFSLPFFHVPHGVNISFFFFYPSLYSGFLLCGTENAEPEKN